MPLSKATTKAISLNPAFTVEWPGGGTSDAYAIILDTEDSEWHNELRRVLEQVDLTRCKLFCRYGAAGEKAEEIVDNWVMDNKDTPVFFPTIADTDIAEIIYTIRTNRIVLLTQNDALINEVETVDDVHFLV